jgi:hypothetical protein
MQNTIAAFIVAFIDEQDTKTTKTKLTASWDSDETQEKFAAAIKAATPKAKRAKKEKKPKDAPKGAKSTYLFFCAEERERIKASKETIEPKEVMAVLGDRWKAFKKKAETKKSTSAKEMEKLTAQAEQDKIRYDAETLEYVPSESSDSEGKKKGTKKKKDPNAPKGACNAYLFFCKDKRAELKEEDPELGPKEVMAELGRCWAELKEENKSEMARYQKLADADKERSKTEKAKYESSSESSSDSGSDAGSESERSRAPKSKKKSAPKPKKSATDDEEEKPRRRGTKKKEEESKKEESEESEDENLEEE